MSEAAYKSLLGLGLGDLGMDFLGEGSVDTHTT
jgi:hypothetical protein